VSVSWVAHSPRSTSSRKCASTADLLRFAGKLIAGDASGVAQGRKPARYKAV
jgi:hypothetical protein